MIWCESRYDAGADTNPPYVGWWQVDGGSYDPLTNTQQAHRQYREWQDGKRSVSPWPNC